MAGNTATMRGERDMARTAALEAEGWRFLRFWNRQVMTDMDSVIDTISAALDDRL
jgi:very-short-patch-repair endonuclease